ncbi:osteopontin [Nothoprocta perdicaria]|uniref:osteopontin n=1 Tax=Nothoprocta perdicaria TaxID=30464 RepID=UPI000E1BB506|nr:osteopontin [Nothoprocta perdicaria]
MKVAVLSLCFISITIAWPLSKSKQHAISASSEEKYDARGHQLHRHPHVNSQSHENPLLPRDDLASPQKTLYSSEERADVLVQERFPAVFSKSHEDPDDDVDDNDSNDTDESDEVVTNFPTDAPVTEPFPPYTRGDNAGRGDSVAYRIKAKAAVMTPSKLHKAARKQLMVHDVTEEDLSALAADSRQEGFSKEDFGVHRFAKKYAESLEWGLKSRGQDSNEVVRKLPARSMEEDSRQKFDRPERDSSEWGARGDRPLSRESRESQARVSAELPDGDSPLSRESQARVSAELPDSDSPLSRESQARVSAELPDGDSPLSRESQGRVSAKIFGDSPLSRESGESRARISAELPDGDNSNQTLESAEDAQDRLSIKYNEVAR